MPALPLDDAGPYVAAAYLVFLALILVYVAIMGIRIARLEREIVDLDDELRAGDRDPAPEPAAREEVAG